MNSYRNVAAYLLSKPSLNKRCIIKKKILVRLMRTTLTAYFGKWNCGDILQCSELKFNTRGENTVHLIKTRGCRVETLSIHLDLEKTNLVKQQRDSINVTVSYVVSSIYAELYWHTSASIWNMRKSLEKKYQSITKSI